MRGCWRTILKGGAACFRSAEPGLHGYCSAAAVQQHVAAPGMCHTVAVQRHQLRHNIGHAAEKQDRIAAAAALVLRQCAAVIQSRPCTEFCWHRCISTAANDNDHHYFNLPQLLQTSSLYMLSVLDWVSLAVNHHLFAYPSCHSEFAPYVKNWQ